YRDGRWENIPVEADGSGLRVSIDHFSKTTSAFLKAAEWVVAEKVPPEWKPLHRAAVEAADAKTKQFYGVGERSTRSHDDMCREFKDVLARYLVNPAPGATTVPADAPGLVALSGYLKHGDAPSVDAKRPLEGITTPGGGVTNKRQVDAYYWEKTAASMDVIRSRMRESGRRLSPAEVLGIAIDANSGNIPLGVLATHNFLKDATYQGRSNGDPRPEGNWTPADVVNVDSSHAEVAGMMQPWRTGDPWSPKGRYDKMGPIYHMFATMTASTWHTSWFGRVAENGEGFLRFFGIGSDVYDPEKGAADTCGRMIGDWIKDPQPIAYFQPIDEPVAIDKPVALTLIIRGLEGQNSITFRVTEGEADLAKSVLQADPEKSGSDCEKIGRELVCGNTVTLTKEGRTRIEASTNDSLASVVLEPAPPRSLTLVEQVITRGACEVDEGNVRAGSPFTQRCEYTIALSLRYSTDLPPLRIFCGIGPQSGETTVSAPSGAVNISVQFSILVQPGVGRVISPSSCFLEGPSENRIATLSLQTTLPGP
ncbi:MAG: hypothetical protein HY873_05100, partial [Chloroflexi bacterium]|nr:hypothetical protein [Chloroflexota bacterium]